MNGLRKKIQILTLSVITAMALMPQFVSAESNNTTQSGIGSISGYDKNKSETGYDYVYLGDYDDSDDGIDNSEPVRWRVLSMRGNGGRYSDESGRVPKSKAIFLLSENALGPKTMFKDVEKFEHKFNEEKGEYDGDPEWKGSLARKWCGDFLLKGMSEQEKSAVLKVEKSDPFIDLFEVFGLQQCNGDKILDKEKVFSLSVDEILDESFGLDNNFVAYARNGEPLTWWLRSNDSELGIIVDEDGMLKHSYPRDKRCVRPALNLDKRTVLFASPVENGKGNFGETEPYKGHEWKLTLKDGNSFSDGTEAASLKVEKGKILKIKHKPLTSFGEGAYTDVTASLTDKDGRLVCYGSINKKTSATGSDIKIPSGLEKGRYKLSIYGEQRNGDKLTDYATGTPFSAEIDVVEPSAQPKDTVNKDTVNKDKQPAKKKTAVDAGKTSEKKTPAALVFSLKKSGKGKVLVKWEKLRDAEKYQISVRKGKKGGFKIKGNCGANKSSYVIKKLKKGRKYKFRMRYLYMDNGKRSWSGWTSVKTIKAR